MKKLIRKTATPISAIVGMFLMALGAQAQTTPVFEYNFPASWGGTGTAVTDQSAAGNNGSVNGTIALSAAVPPGSAGGTQSITTSSAGGITTTGTRLLLNSAIAAAGGFTYDVAFMWDGTDTSGSFGGVEKIVDYSGTESLQLDVASASSADLQMLITGDTDANGVIAASMTIAPNTWYDVTMTFDTQGNVVDGGGDLAGLVSLYVNGSLADSGAATKGIDGDVNYNRPIGIGELAISGTHLVSFFGNIYDPSVSLGVASVPEPSTIALGLMGGLAFLGTAARRRFKK